MELWKWSTRSDFRLGSEVPDRTATARRGTGMATAIPSGIFPISDIRGSRPSRLAAASLSNSGMISPAHSKQPIKTVLLDVLYFVAASGQPPPKSDKAWVGEGGG